MSRKQRIFIAINLPEEIKKELSSFQEKWPELPLRWIKPENLHITLVFLGNINDEELPEIIKVAKEAVSCHQPFSITLNRIIYGPPGKAPRMIWIEGEKSEALGKLQKRMENALLGGALSNFTSENRAYSLHITLARIRQWEFRQIEPEEKPEVNEEINLTFEVNSIEVMESRLKSGGAEYIILETCPLRERY